MRLQILKQRDTKLRVSGVKLGSGLPGVVLSGVALEVALEVALGVALGAPLLP